MTNYLYSENFPVLCPSYGDLFWPDIDSNKLGPNIRPYWTPSRTLFASIYSNRAAASFVYHGPTRPQLDVESSWNY